MRIPSKTRFSAWLSASNHHLSTVNHANHDSPNVGKSSVINTLKKKKVAITAPIPGSTKIWQYVSLMKRISLIDCPGIVPPNQHDTSEDLLLRGVVRLEAVTEVSSYIPAVLRRVKRHHLQRTYDLAFDGEDHVAFLEAFARKSGRLLKGGEPDVDGVAKMIIFDFLRGRIPWFTPCPRDTDTENTTAPVIEGREGRLGEMPIKRKRDEFESVADTSTVISEDPQTQPENDDDLEVANEEFEGFESEDEDDDEVVAGKDSAPNVAKDLTEDEAEDMISLGEISDEESDEESDEVGGSDSHSSDDEVIDGASELDDSEDEEPIEEARRPTKRRRS